MNKNTLQARTPLIEYLDLSPKPRLLNSYGVVLEELPFRTHINLRCDASNFNSLLNSKNILGVELPLEPNTFRERLGRRVYWLGPNEWLVLAGVKDGEIKQQLLERLKELNHSVTDLSGGQTVIRISGANARELLCLGCTLDFHSRVFAVGSCAQSLLADVPVIFCRIFDTLNKEARFELVVRRSYADHVAKWLIDSATYFGVVCDLGATSD